MVATVRRIDSDSAANGSAMSLTPQVMANSCALAIVAA